MSSRYHAAAPAAGLRLHLNENTAGCSAAVLDAVRRLTAADIASYADYSEATAAAARHLGVPVASLVLTNGLDEGILAASLAAAGSGTRAATEAIALVPSFEMYAVCAATVGTPLIEVPLGDDFEFPETRVLDAIGPSTRIVFITDPNNPSGIGVSREAILRVAAAAPRALIFVDEAYADFSGRTLIGDPAVAEYSNVVVGRTFSKAYGLAGLRCGAVVGPRDVIARIRDVLPPYNVNIAAAVALPAALRDRAFYQSYLNEVCQSKALLYECFERLEIRYWRSEANFVLARFGADAHRICAQLAQRGISVRDRSRISACDGCIRITAGVVDHTMRCVAAIEEVLCGGR